MVEDGAGHVVVETPECRHYVSHGIGAASCGGRGAARKDRAAAGPPAPAAGYNCVQGVISAVAYFGNETQYHVQLDSGMVLKVARTNAAHDERRARARAARVCVVGRRRRRRADGMKLARLSGRRAVIAVPFAWLAFAFLVPFLIVLRISFAEMDAAGASAPC